MAQEAGIKLPLRVQYRQQLHAAARRLTPLGDGALFGQIRLRMARYLVEFSDAEGINASTQSSALKDQ